jgi:hypothetical protein
MPPEPRRPDPSEQPVFLPPETEPAQVRLGLPDVLDHLVRSADGLLRVEPATLLGPAPDAARTDEVRRRLATVSRLAGELQAELNALAELQPADPGGPVVT